MTNRRFAVTSRSAAASSPFWASRARRRSSAGSVISGSFWMSWRYWSNAVEGEERKKLLDLDSVACCIHTPVRRWVVANIVSADQPAASMTLSQDRQDMYKYTIRSTPKWCATTKARCNRQRHDVTVQGVAPTSQN